MSRQLYCKAGKRTSHNLLSRGFCSRRPVKNWVNPTYNTAWTSEDIESAGSFQPKHNPKTFVDKLLYFSVRSAYHGFNAISFYNQQDPSGKAVKFRLIFLESIAGVPGMVGAAARHFKSLRTLNRDHGWIHTLLEEAENERMHLLTVMTMFQAGPLAKFAVLVAQSVLAPLLTVVAFINPKYIHRFVGYLEETAVHTYSHIIEKMETPGSKLQKEWGHLMAPDIAKQYWRMEDDATWLDVIKQIMADEANHRDVNHTFASLQSDETNPYIQKHHKASMQVHNFVGKKEGWMFGSNAIRPESNNYLPLPSMEANMKAFKKIEQENLELLFEEAAKQTSETPSVADPMHLIQNMKSAGIPFSAESFLVQLVKRIDLNGDGLIQKSEWRAFLKEVHKC